MAVPRPVRAAAPASFGPGLFRFLAALQRHNRRDWFEAHRQRGGRLRARFPRLVRRSLPRRGPLPEMALLPSRPAVLIPLLFALGACTAPAPAPAEASVKPGINESFLAPDLKVDSFIQRFEGESREIARSMGAIAACCGLSPGVALADVGAGTGLFEPLFDQAVGPYGKVYAVDLSEAFLGHLVARAAEEGWRNVEVIACTERSVELPRRSVDVVFVCDTYHHFEYPESTLASIRAALKPGGLLVVVDFERIEGVSSEWILGHVRAGKEEFRAEIEAAGFRFLDEPEVPGLAENYLLRFRR